MEITPAEAFSILQRARVKKRWAKAGDDKRRKTGRRLADSRKPSVNEPRLQDSRVGEVLVQPASSLPDLRASRIPMADRVRGLLASDATPAGDVGFQLRASLVALREYADEFDREGQREKAVQIHLVLLKHLAKIVPVQSPLPSATDIAALEAEVALMSDDELEQHTKRF
jgi:hypothetical protein